MSIVCFVLIFLSTFIRLCVTMDTVEKENELASSLEENGEEDQVESYSKNQQAEATGHSTEQ